jgi:hypothetical protein
VGIDRLGLCTERNQVVAQKEQIVLPVRRERALLAGHDSPQPDLLDDVERVLAQGQKGTEQRLFGPRPAREMSSDALVNLVHQHHPRHHLSDSASLLVLRSLEPSVVDAGMLRLLRVPRRPRLAHQVRPSKQQGFAAGGH